jgi:transketolase
MRRAFAETLTSLAESDPRIAFITGDLGFQVFDEFEKKFGKRYINAGVAEAQMIYTAAGMALEGWRPFAYSIASFATARPFEQIRYCVAYPALPVILVGAGRGYLYSTSGVSHHAGDDLGLMSSLPGMTVVAPGDPTEIRELLPQLVKRGGPAYFTVGKFGEPTYVGEETSVVGKARKLRSGSRLALLSTGEIANEVLKAVDSLHADGLTPAVYQYHTIKPFDADTLNFLAQEFEQLLVVEEHLPQGGLWTAVCNWYASAHEPPRISRIGVPDQFMFGNLKQDELRRRCGLDAKGIYTRAKELMLGTTGTQPQLGSQFDLERPSHNK